MSGRKITFNKEKSIELYKSGLKYKEIAEILNVNENTLRSFFKRNVINNNEINSKRLENKKSLNIDKNNDSAFELEHSNLLSADDLKELREEKNYGINPNESVGTYSFLLWNRQSYKKGKRKKFIFDENRGAITNDVPSSY
ncbi:helix-turn-helix domain-containing protein [Clostridium pasteurianum]|uniref:DNA-directed RNA polymerase specialized sigma subunit, sigma24 n=1 Tax=Clostridium pasteurianum BC1 TaxID=86416 RepID=R4KAN5_CLOPA|nr:helix-turn-helix domain-containing protein [Clostridium pasteurianum]AGK99623.1 DNA-directed RNA polymerase specialized sigma subunit, sigma24 [Clostridium pasteurianum BC1]